MDESFLPIAAGSQFEFQFLRSNVRFDLTGERLPAFDSRNPAARNL